jgi:hypothetical protein
VVVYTCNLKTEEGEAEDSQFKASLGEIDPVSKNKQTKTCGSGIGIDIRIN